jgi:hypothetical protein
MEGLAPIGPSFMTGKGRLYYVTSQGRGSWMDVLPLNVQGLMSCQRMCCNRCVILKGSLVMFFSSC